MSAFGTSTPLLRAPWGACQNRGRCPHPRSPRGRGAGDAYGLTLHPNHRALGRLQPVKAKPLRGCFASLDRFPAPSASDRFATQGDGKGSRATQSCISPLTPWNRPNTQPRGMWIGFATCPCGLASEWGLGQSPKVLLFGFWLGKLKIIPKKKRCSLCRILEC